MHRRGRAILRMEEGEALAEHLGLVIGLDPQALARVQPSEAPLQLGQDILVHAQTSLAVSGRTECTRSHRLAGMWIPLRARAPQIDHAGPITSSPTSKRCFDAGPNDECGRCNARRPHRLKSQLRSYLRSEDQGKLMKFSRVS